MTAPADAERRGRLLVAGAAIAWSSAGPVQRAVDASPATQVAVRAGVGAFALLAYLVIRRGRATPAAFRSIGRSGLIVAVGLAAGSSAFLLALAHTSVAHALLFQASSPFLAALLAWMLIGERIDARMWAAMATALLGVAIMVGGSLGSGDRWGDVLCLVLAVGFAVVIVTTRRDRHISMTPATVIGMTMAFAVTAPFSSVSDVPAGDLGLLAGLGAAQIALGLVLFTAGARLIPAAQAGLIALLEIVLGPLWVWLIYRERPDNATLIGGAVILAAVLLHALADLRPARLRGRSPAV